MNNTRTAINLFKLSFASCVLATVAPKSSAASLDEAVTEQLRTINGTPCFALLSSVPLSSLRNGLNDICSRDRLFGDSPPASSFGGSAGAQTSLPTGILKRLKPSDKEDTELSFKGINVFFSTEYESLDRTKTAFEDAYDSDLRRLTAGADVRLSSYITMGSALVTYRQNGDFQSGGDFETKSNGILVYGLVQPKETYIQGSIGYYDRSSNRERSAYFESFDVTFFSASGTPNADFDSDEWTASLSTGYDYSHNRFTLSPYLALDWSELTVEQYAEQDSSGLALTFYEEEINSLMSTLGLHSSYTISVSNGVIAPQLDIAWKHEYKNDQREPEVSFVDDTLNKRFSYQTDDPDRDFYEVAASLVFIAPGGIQGFATFRETLSHNFLDQSAIVIGGRLEL